MLKVISFNANGIRSAANKGFYDWLLQQDADFVCIQEVKAQTVQLMLDPLFYPAPYYCEYYDAQKKGYSGVALYAKQKPLQVVRGLGFEYCDLEGRYIRFDYEQFSIVSLYLPSGSSSEDRQAVKYLFLDKMYEHLMSLKEQGRSLILCGDYNIAHKPIDLKNWRSNQKNSGFLPEERAWMDKLYGEWGFIDAFRVVNQEPDQYTWWSYRRQAREKNVGWRIDYQVVSADLAQRVQTANIETVHRFSDHAPLIIEYNL